MAKPTFAQIEEFFRQVDSSKIDSTSFQLFLDGLGRRVRPLTLDEYREMVSKWCCRRDTCHWPVLDLNLYDHPGGWMLIGFGSKQWLSTKCRNCGEELSFTHWGVDKKLLKQI